MEFKTIEGLGGIRAAVVADSVNASAPRKGQPDGVRLVTMQLRYPRFIHAEFMTHRVFSRNASSSRAIPVAKMLEQVRNEPAMPIHWGKNQPGMQAREELDAPVDLGMLFDHSQSLSVQEAWRKAAGVAADIAAAMAEAGYHKQVANRLLEPFQFINVIVTATEWDNFFALRDHDDAQPEIRELAVCMKHAMEASTPVKRYFMEHHVTESSWHLPYVTDEERKLYRLEALIACSAARCARVSYNTHDGQKPDPAKDLELYERLVGSVPIHASPVEHQAVTARHPHFNKNFAGWNQHRCAVERRFA